MLSGPSLSKLTALLNMANAENVGANVGLVPPPKIWLLAHGDFNKEPTLEPIHSFANQAVQAGLIVDSQLVQESLLIMSEAYHTYNDPSLFHSWRATTPDSASFTVTDTGVGVPKEIAHHLFTKFYRADNARKMQPDGTGLGLYMAKKVIVAQGGAIVFKSVEGEGSTFGFSFPRASTEIKK